MQYLLLLILLIIGFGGCDSTISNKKEAPINRQAIVRALEDEPATIDPQKINESEGSLIANDLFEGLVSSDPDGNNIPGVASHWETKDSKTYIFYLRPEAKWSDGKSVTAEDFVYSWQRAVSPDTASTYSWYVASTGVLNAQAIIDGKLSESKLGIRALDQHTLMIELDAPKSYLPSMLAYPTLFPAPKHVIEKYGDTWTQPGHMVSNGAYQLEEWTVNERFVLKRNPYYWNTPNTKINEVDYLVIKSEDAALKRFQANELHITRAIPLEHFKKLKQKQPKSVRVNPSIGTYYYVMNQQYAPFKDIRVRRALSYAVDRKRLTSLVLGQGQLPAYTFIPKAIQGFTIQLPKWATWTQDERNRRAKALLKEAGFDEENPLKFELSYNTSESHKKVAVAIVSMWKEALGCEVTLANQEWKTFLQKIQLRQFEMARFAWIADYSEGISMLDAMSRNNPQNTSGFDNTQYEELLTEIKNTASQQQRDVLYNKGEEILTKEMPIIPIYHYVSEQMVKPYVQGFGNNPLNIHYSKDLSFSS